MQPRNSDDEPFDTAPAGVTDAPSAEVARLQRELDVRTRELAYSEARFRDVIERNADAQVIVDASGTIRFVNTAAARLFGATREQLIGSPLGFPLVAGETTELDLHARGTARVAEMRVMRTEWEGDDAYIASLRDITARKAAEEDARRLVSEQSARAVAERAAARLRMLAESSIVLSSSLDLPHTLSTLAQLCAHGISDWTIVYDLDEHGQPRRCAVAHRDPAKAAWANELREIPIQPDSVHPVLEVLRTRRSRLEPRVSEEALARMTTFPRELELARRLGVTSLMLVPMIARDRPLGAIGFLRSQADTPFTDEDLTLAEDMARRAALAVDHAILYGEAQRANRTKADFLAMVSHDLRTPLTAILGYSDLLAMGVPEPISAGTAERVDRIRTSARHLIYLINELLAFARLDSGKEQMHAAPVSVSAVVREVATIMEPLAEERKLALAVDAPDADLAAVTDSDKLRQVLLNLVGNAVKYTPAGEVRLRLAREDGRILIQVRDTGVGIDPRNLQAIFEPFWQVDPSQRSRGGGTGLGLSVVKRLTTLLGATIRVRSAVGEGSEFTLLLPVSPDG